MKVGFASADWAMSWPDSNGLPTPGGSGWYRCFLPAQELHDRGHFISVGTLVYDTRHELLGVREWSGGVTMDLDVVVLQRCMNEGVHRQIVAARASGQRVLQDVDDWWEGIDPANRVFHTSSPAANPTENRDHYRRSLAASDGIVCSTPFLAENYRRINPRTWVVRNCVDSARWPISRPHDGPPVLGWVGGIPWRSAGDLEALRGFLGPFCRDAGLRVVHAGALAGAVDHEGREVSTFAQATWLDRYGVEVEERPMRPASEIPHLWDGFDVAIVPLSHKPFSYRAKSAIAGMSAAAKGLPFVATDSDEYRWLRNAHHLGRTARTPADWKRHLEALLDPGTRIAEGAGNRRQVLALSPTWMGDAWEGVLAA